MIERKNIIAINLSNGQINFPISYQKNDKFYDIEQSLLKAYPELRNKGLVYLNYGEKIDKGKTIEENKIKNGDNIIFHEELIWAYLIKLFILMKF